MTAPRTMTSVASVMSMTRWLALAAGAALAACNPGAFSDLQDETWVDSADRPDGLSSSGYGAALVSGGSSGAGVSIAVAARTPASVALLTYDEGGGLEQDAAVLHEVTLDGANNLPERPAMASDPDGFTRSPGNIAIGATTGARSYAVILSGSTFDFSTPINLAAGDAPLALGFGDTSAGDGDETDLVALLEGQLVLVRDYRSAREIHSCELTGGVDLLVADVAEEGAGAEILVATPAGVLLIGGAEVVAGTCEGRELVSGSVDPLQRMALGDFDGDGAADLALAAPSERRVLVFMNGGDGTPVEITGPAGSVTFGEALATGDLDRDGADELVVGDGDNSAEVSGGGAAHIYGMTGGGFDDPVTLFDSDPQADQRFGQAVAIARWNDQDDILVVGADGEVFTYFQVPLPGSQDVRR